MAGDVQVLRLRGYQKPRSHTVGLVTQSMPCVAVQTVMGAYEERCFVANLQHQCSWCLCEEKDRSCGSCLDTATLRFGHDPILIIQDNFVCHMMHHFYVPERK